MTRNHQKNASSTKKLVFLITCAALLGAALIADVLWTSSSSLSSSYFSISSNWAIRRPEVLVVPDSSTDNATQVGFSNASLLLARDFVFFVFFFVFLE